MAFRFSLESVLRYRRSLEDREKVLLQGCLLRRTALQAELQAARDARGHLHQQLRQQMGQAPTPAIEIQFCMSCLRGMEVREIRLEAQLGQLAIEIARQSERYQQERRKREVLESLRSSQLSQYRLQQLRREQARLDEMYLLRRGHRPA